MLARTDAEIVVWIGSRSWAPSTSWLRRWWQRERGVCGVVGRCSSVLRCGQGRAFGLAPAGPPLSGLS